VSRLRPGREPVQVPPEMFRAAAAQQQMASQAKKTKKQQVLRRLSAFMPACVSPARPR
jgi:hypothetical protein